MKSPPVSRMALDPEERKKNKRAKNTMKARLLKGKPSIITCVIIVYSTIHNCFLGFYLTQNLVAKSVGKC